MLKRRAAAQWAAAWVFSWMARVLRIRTCYMDLIFM